MINSKIYKFVNSAEAKHVNMLNTKSLSNRLHEVDFLQFLSLKHFPMYRIEAKLNKAKTNVLSFVKL